MSQIADLNTLVDSWVPTLPREWTDIIIYISAEAVRDA